MRTYRWIAVIPVLLLAVAACGGESESAVDEALSRDLALAATAQPYPQQQFMSPMEMGYAQGYPGYGQYPQYPVYGQQQPVYRYPAPQPVSTRRASTGTIYRAPTRSEPIRHTKRDAMIGATAGAIAGAVIGRDVKGAVIGAAAGGLLGAVVGHTIDIERP